MTRYRIALTLILSVLASLVWAQESSTGFENGNNQYVMRESQLSDTHGASAPRPVAVGLEAGTSIDMSGNDLSSFDLDLFAGYRNSFIQCFGLGIGYHPTYSDDRYYIPIYALFRCNLSNHKSLLFTDFRTGYSINRMQRNDTQGGFFGAAGLGINLDVSKKFNSHIIISYNYYQLSPFIDSQSGIQNLHNCHMVAIRLGIGF